MCEIPYIKQAVNEISEKVNRLSDDQKSMYEMLGEHESSIHTLRRQSN